MIKCEKKWRPSRDMVWVLVGVRGCILRPMGHSLVTLFSLSVSVKDRPLHWILVKSWTYYPKHILVFGSREGPLFSYRGFRLFPNRLIGGGDGGGLSTTLNPGVRCGAWGPSLDGDLDPLTRECRVGTICAWGTSRACVSGYPAGHIDS